LQTLSQNRILEDGPKPNSDITPLLLLNGGFEGFHNLFINNPVKIPGAAFLDSDLMNEVDQLAYAMLGYEKGERVDAQDHLLWGQ
jgi:hypothetical protein